MLWCSHWLLRHRYYSPACFWTNPSSHLRHNIHLSVTELTRSWSEKMSLWVWMTCLYSPVKFGPQHTLNMAYLSPSPLSETLAVLFFFICDVDDRDIVSDGQQHLKLPNYCFTCSKHTRSVWMHAFSLSADVCVFASSVMDFFFFSRGIFASRLLNISKIKIKRKL